MGIEEIRKLKSQPKPTGVKKTYTIPKVSKKKAAKIAQTKGVESELQKWYFRIIKQLTGVCSNCGARYNHKKTEYAIPCIAHIFAKRKNMFPSVATHEHNWIELGATCGCHHKFDNSSWEDCAKMKCFSVVLEKAKEVIPDIVERNKIPDLFFL